MHATGFCKELWTPLVERHLTNHPVIAPDQRGHGDSTPITAPFDWWTLAGDTLAVLDYAGWSGVTGLGHSSGAAALVMAELLRPGTFGRLVLIEPIIFPGPPYHRFEDNPMSAAALRRRSTFESADAVVASYQGRGPFSGWDADVLRAYAEYGFAPDGEGGWTLKCPPEQEAEFYRGATLHGAWSRLGEIGCPTLLVGGADSSSHPRSFLEAQAARFPEAVVRVVEEATHFVPMERPGVIADLIPGTRLD